MVRILISEGGYKWCFSEANIFLIATELNYKSKLISLAKKKKIIFKSDQVLVFQVYLKVFSNNRFP